MAWFAVRRLVSGGLAAVLLAARICMAATQESLPDFSVDFRSLTPLT